MTRRALEYQFLALFHATISGSFLVAYLTGDEDTYGMHVVAGYAVLAALALRLLAAVFASADGPLALRRPRLPAMTAWLRRLVRGDRRARQERSPIYPWMAAALLAGVLLAAASGAIADFVVSLEDLHEALGELALWIVIGHVAIVLSLHLLRRSARRAPPLPAASIATATAATGGTR